MPAETVYVFDACAVVALLKNEEGAGVVESLLQEESHRCLVRQRRVPADLKRTFPGIQFVCTSHSAQVIGEVARDEVRLLRPEGITPPAVARGADSNWILDHVMDGAISETPSARRLKDEAEVALEDGDLQAARVDLKELRRLLDGDTGELVRLESSLYALEALTDGEGDGADD